MTVRRGGLALGLVLMTAAAIAALSAGRVAPDGATAASHREAPLISLDPAADISDFFLFRSYEPGKSDRLVLIMNVNPGEEPSSGPNYYGFDPSVTYSFGIDNDRDGKADDVRFDVRFANEIRGFTKDLGLPLRYIGGGPLPVVDDVDDPGNGLRQTYRVTMNGTKLHDGSLPVLPDNVGPRTTPNYEANFLSEGIKTLDGGIRVFAGPRDDPFYIDLGGAFDTLNLNPFVRDSGIDMLAGHNVHTIAIEVPIAMVSSGSGVDRRLRVHQHGRRSRSETTTGRRQATRAGRTRPGAAAREPARQRADHRDGRQGPLERDEAARGVAVPRLLPQAAVRPRGAARVQHADRVPHRRCPAARPLRPRTRASTSRASTAPTCRRCSCSTTRSSTARDRAEPTPTCSASTWRRLRPRSASSRAFPARSAVTPPRGRTAGVRRTT